MHMAQDWVMMTPYLETRKPLCQESMRTSVESAIFNHMTPSLNPPSTRLAPLVLPVLCPHCQQIKPIPQIIKPPCLLHTKSSWPKTGRLPMSHWPMSKAPNTVIPVSCCPLPTPDSSGVLEGFALYIGSLRFISYIFLSSFEIRLSSVSVLHSLLSPLDFNLTIDDRHAIPHPLSPLHLVLCTSQQFSTILPFRHCFLFAYNTTQPVAGSRCLSFPFSSYSHRLLVGYRPYSAYKNPMSGFVKELGNYSPFHLLQDIPELPLLGQYNLASQTLPFFSRSPSCSCLTPPTSQKGPLNNHLVLRPPLGLQVAWSPVPKITISLAVQRHVLPPHLEPNQR